jgi:small subunit ribosomal protein S8
MSMTDPIADLLTRIRNGLRAKKRWVNIPSSNEKMRILFILKEEKYIEDFILIDDKVKKQIRIFLKYDYRGIPVIAGIERISKPGLRIYKNRKDLPAYSTG